MRRFVLPGMIAAAAVALLALLAFGVSNQSDNSSIEAQVARGSFPNPQIVQVTQQMTRP
jgi:hypothetical protein